MNSTHSPAYGYIALQHPPIAVVETVRFLKDADRLMPESDRAELVGFIAANLARAEFGSSAPPRFTSKTGIAFFIPLGDPYAISIADNESDSDEQRFVTLGMGAAGRLPVVVYTWRGENIRIISARPAEPHEHNEYEAEL